MFILFRMSHDTQGRATLTQVGSKLQPWNFKGHRMLQLKAILKQMPPQIHDEQMIIFHKEMFHYCERDSFHVYWEFWINTHDTGRLTHLSLVLHQGPHWDWVQGNPTWINTLKTSSGFHWAHLHRKQSKVVLIWTALMASFHGCSWTGPIPPRPLSGVDILQNVSSMQFMKAGWVTPTKEGIVLWEPSLQR